MSLLPRLRLALARRPWLYWSSVAVCAAVVWLGVASAQAGVAAERDAWGSTRPVWVATEAAVPGGPLRAERREYPAAMVPVAAVTLAADTGAWPADASAARSVSPGEVLTAADLAAADGLAPPGWVVFGVPAAGQPTLVAGDEVAVFGSGQRWCDGVVVAVGSGPGGNGTDRFDVAVPSECARDLSAQLALGAVTLARLV
ncbi:MAG: hypothetical protein Q7V88_01260 [Actinomycetota bacterium]|nr:hypothetical protein [Actinomycetota bacterium]